MHFPPFYVLVSLPNPETIRRKAAEVVGRPDFQLDGDVDRESIGLLLRLLEWFLTPFRWLFNALDGLPEPVRWLVVVALTVALIGLLLHIVWSFVRAIGGIPRRSVVAASRERGATPDGLERDAERAEAEGNYIGAVRLLFRASLLRIERAEERSIRRGITNGELLRRYRTSPLFGPLQRFVETIDAKWYGPETCVPDDYVTCRTEYARIRGLVERRPHAISP